MTDDLIRQIITGAPNFVGFIVLTLALMRIIGKQFDLIVTLMEKWEHCEDDTEKARLTNLRPE